MTQLGSAYHSSFVLGKMWPVGAVGMPVYAVYLLTCCIMGGAVALNVLGVGTSLPVFCLSVSCHADVFLLVLGGIVTTACS